MIRKFFGNILLALTVLFLVISGITLFAIVFMDDEQAGPAFIGMLIITSFFAVPYFLFFRPRKTNKKNNEKQKLISRRCDNCSSTQFTTRDQGLQCDHCGTFYN